MLLSQLQESLLKGNVAEQAKSAWTGCEPRTKSPRSPGLRVIGVFEFKSDTYPCPSDGVFEPTHSSLSGNQTPGTWMNPQLQTPNLKPSTQIPELKSQPLQGFLAY